jgi:cleavage and polyadenylation specificity factor subunit 1
MPRWKLWRRNFYHTRNNYTSLWQMRIRTSRSSNTTQRVSSSAQYILLSRISQYLDPEAISSRRLLHKSTFHTGHFPIDMHLLSGSITLPASDDDRDDTPFSDEESSVYSAPGPSTCTIHQALLTTQTGALGLITPVDELTYLRLNTLQTYISTQLDSPCGLNAQAYRAVDASDGEQRAAGSTKDVLDGNILRRWSELPKQRRADACLRMGVDEESVRRDLDVVFGGALVEL